MIPSDATKVTTTDHERARTAVAFIATALAPDAVDADLSDIEQELAEEFSAVRLDERRAIAAYLRTVAPQVRGGVLSALADQILRGEHGS